MIVANYCVFFKQMMKVGPISERIRALFKDHLFNQ